MPRTQTPSLKKTPTAPPAGRPRRTADPVKKKRGADVGKIKNPATLAKVRGLDTGTKAAAAMVDVNKPLTEMQKLFVKEWAAGNSILSASYRAGYADGGAFAYRMTVMPNILALYNAEKLAYEAAAGMSRKKVMDMLLKAYEHAELAGEPASMVSAAREVGKMCGYYEPVRHKVDVSVNGTVIHKRLSSMSDGELLDLITGGKALDALEGN